jgi:hypothetical protein
MNEERNNSIIGFKMENNKNEINFHLKLKMEA